MGLKLCVVKYAKKEIYNGINEYEVLGQVNPSLYKINDKYMLFYNGKNKNEKWSGSYLVTNDFINYKSLKTPNKHLRLENVKY